MHPTSALSIVLLSWCFFRNRSMGSRSLLGAALALLGWEPAAGGNQVGVVLILIAIGALLAALWDLSTDAVLARRRATALAAATGPVSAPVSAPVTVAGPTVAPSPPPPARGIKRTRRPSVPPPPGAVRAATPMPPAPEWATATPERTTEYDRADAFGDLLEANLAGLVDAYRSGDVRAQAAFAGEIADVARGMETLLRVVVAERHRIHGIDPWVDVPGGGPTGPTGPTGSDGPPPAAPAD